MGRIYIYNSELYNSYFIMDDNNRRSAECLSGIYVKHLLSAMTKKKAFTGFFINSIEESQLQMYLALNPKLTLKELIDIVGDTHANSSTRY